MNPDSQRYLRIKDLFLEAADLEGAARDEFLSRACEGDDELRAAVEQRLASVESESGFLQSIDTPGAAMRKGLDDSPTSDLFSPVDEPDDDDAPLPDRIGRYHIVDVIATGGMGRVYLAMQEEPRRKVALKVMRTGIASRSALRRFQFEAQTLARLRHPNIAQVYEAGTHYEESVQSGGEGTPFFAMEYVPGAKALTHYAEHHRLNLEERLELFVKVCDAVHYGHQKGIIHRDLKPANILVTPGGEPKIIDFGVARATDSDMAVTTQQTNLGQLIGTLQYMSPEQCQADPDDIDTRSDVYALGVVLYELVCERLPYDLSKAHIFEATRIVCEQPPQRPSLHDRTLHGDIDTILTKSLEKDRNRRYHSAHELAADIKRYVHDEPIMARPPSVTYQLVKFARRNRGLVAAGVAVFVALLLGFIVSTTQAIRARTAEADATMRLGEATAAQRVAEDQRKEAQRQAAIAQAVVDFLNDDLLAAVDPFNTSDPDISMREALDIAADKVDTAFEEQPEVEAAVRMTLGQTYRRLGHFDAAETHYRIALMIRRSLLGENHADTLSAMQGLGGVYTAQGRFDDAKSYLSDVLNRRTEILGEDDPDTLITMATLGQTYRETDEFDEAEPYLTKAYEGRRRVLGDQHRDTLNAMGALALLYKAQGRLHEATPLLEGAYGSFMEHYGPEYPDTLSAMSSLADQFRDLGRTDDAIRMQERNVAIRRRIYGDGHPSITPALSSVAAIYAERGQLDVAKQYREEILEIRRTRLGEDHPETALAVMSLAVVESKRRRYTRAAELFEDAYTRSLNALGPTHRQTVKCRAGYAMCLAGLGQFDEAETIYLEVLQTRREVFEPDHPLISEILHLLGSLHLKTKAYDRALPNFEEALSMRVDYYGPEHLHTLTTRSELARAYQGLGRIEDARREFEFVFDSRTRTLGDAHPTTIVALVNRGTFEFRHGSRELSADLYKDAIARADRTYPEDHPSPAQYRRSYGNVLRALKRYPEAEEVLLVAFDRYEAIYGLEHDTTQGAVRALIRVYEVSDRPEDAVLWRAKEVEQP